MRKALVVVAALLALLPACRRKPGPPDVPGLIAQLHSADLQKRGQARLTLIALGEQAAPALAGMLRSGTPEDRLAAANILWGMGPRGRAAVPELAQALDDGDQGLQLAAAMALQNIGPGADAAVPALVRALGERRDRAVRQTAAKALGAIGPGARDAVPALTRELRRGHWPEAEEAVRRIRGLAPGAPIDTAEAGPR
jgi:HEAT repeat protein